MLCSGTWIIPALAGNTRASTYRQHHAPDHPRSRGEYPACLLPPTPTLGSSPLSRGILRGSVGNTEPPRIIPALAGNTRVRWPKPPNGSDHPRSRGEYRTRGARPELHGGSSPLSRGIRYPPAIARCGRGIIPALAGNKSIAGWDVWLDGDHPRSRGEYLLARPKTHTGAGSSPLSRGIPRPPCPAAPRPRIIPALAGNT